MTRPRPLLLDPPGGLHDAVLATRPEPLLDAVGLTLTPRRILLLGDADPGPYAQRYPDAELVLASLLHPAPLPDEQDLIVVHFELARRAVDLRFAVAELWSLLREGGCLAVLELGRVPDPELRRALATSLRHDLARPVIATLRRNFDSLHLTEAQQVAGAYTTLGWLGRKGLDGLPWARA